ncbi:MAG: hypothetical protein PHU07_13380 [Acidocella sp.]|nr:hypothetical protein [Acidocella sp.]
MAKHKLGANIASNLIVSVAKPPPIRHIRPRYGHWLPKTARAHDGSDQVNVLFTGAWKPSRRASNHRPASNYPELTTSRILILVLKFFLVLPQKFQPPPRLLPNNKYYAAKEGF